MASPLNHALYQWKFEKILKKTVFHEFLSFVLERTGNSKMRASLEFGGE